jgi:2-haloalkanoic acid dehalogenase type II
VEAQMALRKTDYDAVTFDVYGTVLDWEPEIADFLAAWAAGQGLQVSREELLSIYDRVRQPLQEQRPALPYPEVLKRSLDAVAAEFGGKPESSDREAFGRIAGAHKPFADSAAALEALSSMGFRLGALSNIDDASFETAATAAGIRFDIVVTAERVGAYKPDHAHFRTALADLSAMDIPPDRVLHVAQSLRADIVPANALGLRSVWVDRPGHIFGRAGKGAEDARPDHVVHSLAEVVSLFE